MLHANDLFHNRMRSRLVVTQHIEPIEARVWLIIYLLYNMHHDQHNSSDQFQFCFDRRHIWYMTVPFVIWLYRHQFIKYRNDGSTNKHLCPSIGLNCTVLCLPCLSPLPNILFLCTWNNFLAVAFGSCHWHHSSADLLSLPLFCYSVL